MKTLTLVGAGGKMGLRCVENLISSNYKCHYLEINPEAIKKLEEKNVEVSCPAIISVSDIVVLAVPDNAIRAVSKEVIPKMKPGAMIVALDPAAPLAGHVLHRDDLVYYVPPTHRYLIGRLQRKPTEITMGVLKQNKL
jgi:3-hydroxyisobutyrate dehydrogenase-like beta-hydroxyacid dehydrogenase